MGRARAGLRSQSAMSVRAFASHGVAAEVVGALDAAGVPSIVLGGPSPGDWPCGKAPPERRLDVLVSPAAVAQAENVLSEIGFHDELQHAAPCERSEWTATWSRGAAVVDLSRTVAGATVTPEDVWRELSERCRPLHAGSCHVEFLEPAALACISALKAAQHGKNEEQPLADLLCALRCGTEAPWRDALTVAIMLGALAAFGTGLRLVPDGRPVAQALGLSHGAPMDVLIRAESSPFIVRGFQQVLETRGGWQKTRLVARKTLPTPAALRASSSFARRGVWALGLCYLWRPIRVAVSAVPGFVRWFRLHRMARA